MTADDSLTAWHQLRTEIVDWCQSDLNEADTRAKVIDLVFKSVLGWEESAIRRETRTTDGDYLDYAFDGESNRFIVEAKRAGAYFEMPQGAEIRARRNGVLATSPSLHAALTQVVDYCQSQARPVGVVSNGVQFAVTLTYEPAGSRYDTLLFDGLETIEKNFVLFWNLLSPFGKAQGELERVLGARDYIRAAPQFTNRILDAVTLPDEAMNRNPVDAPLAPIIRRYFSDLTDESRADVLEQAYVESGRQAHYEQQLDALLLDRAPRLGPSVETIETTRRAAPILDKGLLDASASEPEGSVFLLVGGVGAGKTTFEHRYFQFLIDSKLRDVVLPVFVDFTRVNEEGPDVSEFVDREVIRELEERYPDLELGTWECLQRIYEQDIADLRRGVLAPYYRNSPDRFQELVSDEIRKWMLSTEQHVGRITRYLRTHVGRQLCVVLDNGDQLGQDFQRRALKLAFQKSRVWKVIGLLSLREETYWRFRNAPPFDAYHRYAYHIAAPRVTNVMSRRLDLAKNQVGSQVMQIHSRTGIEFHNISVGEFLEIMVDSFLGEDQRNIVLLEALAANDVRQALDMFATFLTSGHTNTDEYIKIYIDSRRYRVPFHHVFRSIALAERRYFDSRKSLIDNLFSLEDDGFFSHFQKIRVLRYLYGVRQLDAAPGRGFMDVGRVSDAFARLVSDEEGLRRVLDSLLRHRLVEAANGYRATGDQADAVRITSSGYYYLATLVSDFSYLDLCCVDTPVKSREWFEKLHAVALSGGTLHHGLKERMEKVSLFTEYLQVQEQDEQQYLRASGLPEAVVAPVMGPLRERLEAQLADIAQRAAKWGSDRPRGDQN